MLEKLFALSKLTKLTIWGAANFIIALIGFASLLPGPLIDFNKPDVAKLADILPTGDDFSPITGAIAGLQEKGPEALINVSEVKVKNGRLEPFRVTIENLGNSEINPKLEVSVSKKRTAICSDSVQIESALAPGQKIEKELSLICSFDEPSDYILSITLLDQDLNVLDSADKKINVEEHCELGSA